MKCINCSRQIEDNSLFCNWCGHKQLKEKKKELKVPKPRQLPSGSWFIQLRSVSGKSVSITQPTEELCIAEAKAIKAGLLDAAQKLPSKTLGAALDEYTESRSNIISPATLRTYRHIRKYRFQSLMDKSVRSITLSEFQNAINLEASNVKPKTLRNAWGLIRSAIKGYTDLNFSYITLPQKDPSSVKIYEPEHLQRLFIAVRDTDIELAILLAACLGLRRSEILGLTRSCFDFTNRTVSITQALVPNDKNELVLKGTKTEKSTRILPCPQFILDKVPHVSGYIYGDHKQNYILERLKSICKQSGLPDITLHGLRHTNASVMLALNIPDKYAMERGGWSNNQTMKNIYQHTLESERVKSDTAVNEYFENLVK